MREDCKNLIDPAIVIGCTCTHIQTGQSFVFCPTNNRTTMDIWNARDEDYDDDDDNYID